MPNAASTKEKVAELKQDTEIQKALDQTAPSQQPFPLPSKRKRKFFLTTYLLDLFLLGAAYYLV